jgi:hypothetical protein
MVSIDHYAHELRAQLDSAAERGAKHIIIVTIELHHSLSERYETNDECWKAMEAEMLHGDSIVTAGLSVRYVLPRHR